MARASREGRPQDFRKCGRYVINKSVDLLKLHALEKQGELPAHSSFRVRMMQVVRAALGRGAGRRPCAAAAAAPPAPSDGAGPRA
ncbi:hypothetical protein EVAR_11141_1 [Eumeta japonica]|uniref:Uncharacterized protein n=1 Tax=Eumeta variegata TaxID=151549 RepID=A0A4C1U4D6_EUMVA|nr:hypothetical protein EVAR_11141_1 [Eumeta japonica]